jgi:N-acetylglucosamine kinase-like BadF-type ATPase
MADEYLAIYLNDHLAGSLMAVELLQHLERAYSGQPVQRFAADLRADIEDDRRELRMLMDELDVAESRARQATAWVAEKMTLIKLRLDDWAGGQFRLFEALEALSLGIEGKKALWIALEGVAERAPALRRLDYRKLVARALDQRDRVEAKRLETATAALLPVPQAG